MSYTRALFEGRRWNIIAGSKSIMLDAIKETKNQDNPVLLLCNEGRDFLVEFNNRSDFAASEYGKLLSAQIVLLPSRRRIPCLINKIHYK